MDLFDVSEWSVNASSDRLNKKLFGTLTNEKSKKDDKNNHKDLKRKSDIDGDFVPKKSKMENKVKKFFESKSPGIIDTEMLKTEGKYDELKSSKKKKKKDKRNVNQAKGSDTESSVQQTRELIKGNKDTRQCSTNGRVKDKQKKGPQHMKFSIDVLEKNVLGDPIRGTAGGSEPLTKKQKRKLKEKKRIQRKKQERLAREAARNDSASQRMKQSAMCTGDRINNMKNAKKKITDTMKFSFGCEKSEGDTVKSFQQKRKRKKKSSKKNKYKHLANNKAAEENDSKETCESARMTKKAVVNKIKQNCSTGSDKVKSKKRKLQEDLNDGGIHKTEVVLKKKKHVEMSSEETSTTYSFKKKEHEQPETCIEKKIKTPRELSLRERMMDKLNSARFRYLNEQMYTSSGKEAEEMFVGDIDSYKVYHDGFQTQVSKWPVNPLDEIITQLKNVEKNIMVADMGCGEAKLAKKLQNTVHSFDLVALNERVTVANISKVPLQARSVDIVVFCLSLMGTNLVEYIIEANRILKNGGIMKIAEVMSRFKEGLNQFITNVEKVGFSLLKKDKSNQYFVMFDFKKTGSKKQHVPDIDLAPCIYKKR